jgi:uncharacterized DUF497 family protein
MTLFNEEIAFEWDEAKAESNRLKHGIDFNDAINVFSDPNAYADEDVRFEYGETRIKIIGKIDDQLIAAVLYTDRLHNIRIISARKARKDEKEKYHSQS